MKQKILIILFVIRTSSDSGYDNYDFTQDMIYNNKIYYRKFEYSSMKVRLNSENLN